MKKNNIFNIKINSPFEKEFNLETLYNEFNNYIHTLNGEKLISLANLLLNGVIISSLISIATGYFGQYLIDYFNLESRYPKIAKIIKLRKTLYKYYFRVNLAWIIISYSILLLFNLAVLLNLK